MSVSATGASGPDGNPRHPDPRTTAPTRDLLVRHAMLICQEFTDVVSVAHTSMSSKTPDIGARGGARVPWAHRRRGVFRLD